MLTELEIQGFRCFPSLTAKPLGRVNLLVGKNNSGKTAFLDAVELLAWDGARTPFLRSLVRRSEYGRETVEESPGRLISKFDFYPMHLFHGHRLSQGTEFFIQAPGREVRCSYEYANRILRIHRVPTASEPPTHLTANGIHSVATGQFEEAMHHQPPGRTPVLFLPTERADVPLLSRLWDEVQLTDDESLIPAALRFIEPGVEKVGRRGEGENLHFVVRLKGDKEPRRLGSLGDGMRHILALALHLVPAKDGYLLIDEIDTGLHYSVLAQMWRMVIESARRLNIQVFATTHSMDCIQALAEVHQQMKLTPEDLMLHRLEPDLGKTISYTPDEIVDAAQFHGEVR